MCGLIGALGLVPPPDRRWAGLAALADRGPDGASELVGADFWIGHTLLSVRGGLGAASSQPVIDAGRRFAFAYNGEAYGGERDGAAGGAAPRDVGDEAAIIGRAAAGALAGRPPV